VAVLGWIGALLGSVANGVGGGFGRGEGTANVVGAMFGRQVRLLSKRHALADPAIRSRPDEASELPAAEREDIAG